MLQSDSTLGKRKRLSPPQREQLRNAILEQFDLDLALKQRLLASANARLEWARILKTSIVDRDDYLPASGYPPTAYRDAALVTYEAIEEPCRFIIPDIDGTTRRHINGRNILGPEKHPSEAPRTRKRATFGLGHTSAPGPLLFEDNSNATPVTLKLVCTDCSRSDFPTMQGFLNHCRLAHLRNFGTHDECIQECGVCIEPDEREALAASGVEIKTIRLLSLKGIFERAVGLGRSVGPERNDWIAAQLEDKNSTHLSQTLGLHKDTPMLAPFLGKEVKKKVIHVSDDPEPIDVMKLEENVRHNPRPPWIIKHKEGGDMSGGTSINMAVLAAEMGKVEVQHVLDGAGDHGSRFHIMRRILVSDRSLYLSPTKRPSNPDTMSHTHRWQVSVSTPSYEQHISTFLARLTVTCATQPPVFTFPITVSGPPFIACSTADRPFLARLTLTWVGDQNNEYVIEHWVELDAFKANRPVLGEEQMLDVELDRKTRFLPASIGASTVPWSGEADHENSHYSKSPVDESKSGKEKGSCVSFGHSPHLQLLKNILPRFPMTLQDVGSRQSPRVPYTVHPTPAKLLGLTVGRRKAIEWGRASAIRSEYESLIASSPPAEDYVSLTTADIFRWLDSEGLFPRSRPKTQKLSVEPPQSIRLFTSAQERTIEPSFCSICGVDVRFHVPGIPFGTDHQEDGEPDRFHCPAELERRRAPLVHLYALVAPLRIPYWALRADRTQHNITRSSSRDIISVANPHITQLARREAGSLSLSKFMTFRTDKYEVPPDRSREELETILAPYALLGTVVEKVLRDIVGSAFQVARENQSRMLTASGKAQGAALRSLLSPTHVLQGLVKGAEMGGPKEALFKCLARVGTVLETAHSGGRTATSVSGSAQ